MKSRVRLYCYLRLYIPMLQQLSWLAPPLPLRSFSPRQICCCPQHVFQRTGSWIDTRQFRQTHGQRVRTGELDREGDKSFSLIQSNGDTCRSALMYLGCLGNSSRSVHFFIRYSRDGFSEHKTLVH